MTHNTQGLYDGSLLEVAGLGGQSIFVDTAKSTPEPLPALPFEVRLFVPIIVLLIDTSIHGVSFRFPPGDSVGLVRAFVPCSFGLWIRRSVEATTVSVWGSGDGT